MLKKVLPIKATLCAFWKYKIRTRTNVGNLIFNWRWHMHKNLRIEIQTVRMLRINSHTLAQCYISMYNTHRISTQKVVIRTAKRSRTKSEKKHKRITNRVSVSVPVCCCCCVFCIPFFGNFILLYVKKRKPLLFVIISFGEGKKKKTSLKIIEHFVCISIS